jgi:hypothetical protein
MAATCLCVRARVRGRARQLKGQCCYGQLQRNATSYASADRSIGDFRARLRVRALAEVRVIVAALTASSRAAIDVCGGESDAACNKGCSATGSDGSSQPAGHPKDLEAFTTVIDSTYRLVLAWVNCSRRTVLYKYTVQQQNCLPARPHG